MNLVDRARAYAAGAHLGQRYGSHPYVVHLDEVAAILMPFGSEHQAAGYLHDVLEDTGVELGSLRERFGDLIARWVQLVTDEPGRNRRERKLRTYPKLAAIDMGSTDAGALVIKAADRLANLRACIRDDDRDRLRMYRQEHSRFDAVCYRPGLCNDLWVEIHTMISEAPE